MFEPNIRFPDGTVGKLQKLWSIGGFHLVLRAYGRVHVVVKRCWSVTNNECQFRRPQSDMGWVFDNLALAEDGVCTDVTFDPSTKTLSLDSRCIDVDYYVIEFK